MAGSHALRRCDQPIDPVAFAAWKKEKKEEAAEATLVRWQHAGRRRDMAGGHIALSLR